MKIEDRGSRGRKKVRETDGQWKWVVPVGGEASAKCCQQKVVRVVWFLTG